jgi:OHCU decarboxylase
MTLEELNALGPAVAEQELLRCCGARRWARAMAESRPFPNLQALRRDADDIWLALEAVDWREAFAAHPRIGDSAARKGGDASAWSAREQAGMNTATDDVRLRLEAANREYEQRFGFILIVCATGLSADEMLAMAEQRLNHSRDEELVIAAEEQRKITQIRLATLLT